MNEAMLLVASRSIFVLIGAELHLRKFIGYTAFKVILSVFLFWKCTFCNFKLQFTTRRQSSLVSTQKEFPSEEHEVRSLNSRLL